MTGYTPLCIHQPAEVRTGLQAIAAARHLGLNHQVTRQQTNKHRMSSLVTHTEIITALPTPYLTPIIHTQTGHSPIRLPLPNQTGTPIYT